MLCSWPDFLAFLYRSTMCCLFSCFRIRDDRHLPSSHIVSEQSPSKIEPVVHRNRKRLGSLTLSEEKDGSLCNERQYHLVGDPKLDFDFRGLKEEAKFLEACCTLPETPAEILKASKILKDLPPNRDSESSKIHSWLPNTSIQKLNLEIQPDQPPTPFKLSEELVNGLGSLARTPSSGKIPARISTSTSEANSSDCNLITDIHGHTSQTASVQYRNKSVHFDCQSDVSSFSSKGSSSEVYSQNSKQSELVGNESVSKPSPYPTPLKLSNDMQTPGTVFPSYVGNMGTENNPRIRSQYVYSVFNPVENLSQWKVLKEEHSNSTQLLAHLAESFEQADKATPSSEEVIIQNSAEKELKVEASLSWLKQLPTNQNANNQRVVSFASENAYFGKTPGDRPILGMVAAHWNENEHSRISPKWWDGNGIPNSTTKYKEDQKVSWHATPFEERLEKALSEETIISQRKNISGTPTIDFDDNEECDTARSQMKSSTHFNSVVSC